MPDPQYQPNDPRYYTVRDKFGNMGIGSIENHLHQGGVLVTAPSGKAICYHLDNTTGRIRVSCFMQCEAF